MNAQSVIGDARLTHVRELKTALEKCRAENARLRTENDELKAHLDLALLAAEDLRNLPEGGRFVIVDGWNAVLGAGHRVRNRAELAAQWERHLSEHPGDFVWIVLDGPHEAVETRGRLRQSYTGGHGPHRADRFICDFLRMARFRGDVSRIDVITKDKDFLSQVRRIVSL